MVFGIVFLEWWLIVQSPLQQGLKLSLEPIKDLGITKLIVQSSLQQGLKHQLSP